jgi:hypothetical protein
MLVAALAAVAVGATTIGPATAKGRDPVRFATFNASLNRATAGALADELINGPITAQTQAVLDIIELNSPDVLLINEFDFDPAAAARFAELADYPYHFSAPSNTGIPSGFDLNNDGVVGGPDDALGFGFFPGQFGMLVLSRYPIGDVRTFQNFLWKDMPGAILPDDPSTPAPADWYSPDELAVLPVSSKSHWDLEIEIPRRRHVHFLVSHPTPPVFDGAEDRNGTRNFDEIGFWADYVRPKSSRYIYDDAGGTGGLRPGAKFVIAGDQNSDPFDGDSIAGAAQQLLENPRVNTSVTPSSEGAVEQAGLQGGANDSHVGDPAFDTADFADSTPGNLRADYVLPAKAMRIHDAGVFWPTSDDPDFPLVGTFPFPSSDHRLVWVDIR